MSMIRWDPAKDLMSLKQAVDRLIDESFSRPSRFSLEIGVKDIPIDMYQTENEVIIKAPLPGVNPEAVDISISGDMLTLKAEVSEEKETREKDYFYRENRFGSFSRTVTLPVPVKSNEADAMFENGVLTLTLPKAEEAKPRQIKVKSKESGRSK